GIEKYSPSGLAYVQPLIHQGLNSKHFFCGDEFKALVLEFRSNGNLEVWINPKVRSQNPPKLLRVAEDIATTLDYLHNRFLPWFTAI
ncbi:Os10g0118100, partial [Oryza sativa Japonica Group]